MQNTSPANTGATTKSIIWVLLSGAMALAFAVMLFVPGSGTGSGWLSVYAIMLWCGLFGANLSHYCGKNGWIGFAMGSLAGMVIQITSQFA
ncbi:hypothetical protein DXV75_12110 [Alteromonas aestuariivivens]|uniref:DUF1097 domain-containing protein n=1 Tax=Alteromonas aestuariivivens TaxID=1938339 RepID=A0A3D8M558_9ALTE|nr:hypothetical protein [Alteromonas aestuariivivens]RDV24819.1 hypothetical protein DXV75_12110 [Alteromonas aestuariivivens]